MINQCSPYSSDQLPKKNIYHDLHCFEYQLQLDTRWKY